MGIHERLMETTAKGDSMTPFIESGARIILDMSPKHVYRTGDIVAYIGSKGSLVVHRIIYLPSSSSVRGTYMLKGDHNKGADRYVYPRRIVGKVQRIVYPSYTIDVSTPFPALAGRLIAYFGKITSARPWFYGAERLVTRAFAFIIVNFRRTK